MSDRSRKTSDIVKHVDEVEETIPDFYGPQPAPPADVKKGDMWFISETRKEPDTIERLARPPKVRPCAEYVETKKKTRPLESRPVQKKTYYLLTRRKR